MVMKGDLTPSGLDFSLTFPRLLFGTYEIRLRAVDRAGNRSVRTRAVPVRVRFVELSRDRIEVGVV